MLARTEGIIPALESAHAVAEVIKRAPRMKKSEIVIVNVSGRGDKDIGILRENLKLDRDNKTFTTRTRGSREDISRFSCLLLFIKSRRWWRM